MSTKALAKTADLALNDAPDEPARDLRDLITQIIRQEYSGDKSSEFWIRPATAAADRIMRAIYGSRSL